MYSKVLVSLRLLAIILSYCVGAGGAFPIIHDDMRSGSPLWLRANGLRLKAKIYESLNLSDHPVLVLVLHGDLLGVRTLPVIAYHYVFAQRAAVGVSNVVVAALLRPGYRDETGERSEGQQGEATGDNYTPEVVDAVAEAIEQLKTKFHAAHTVLVGHSGGAAITGDLLGRWPSAVDAALMVSCPCDLALWRKHMLGMQNNNPIWLTPVESLSPVDLASKVLPSLHVELLVGSADSVAPPEMSERYAKLLQEHSKNVTLTIAPGLGHDILLEPVALRALATLVDALNKHRAAR
ncbi:MAG: prolyl oligopeptidase family serine peptidase [Acidobacteria bacterium]|nr:prolyl oligopeptidase family serine peptidase [Acidobacteriota bacterium]